MPLFSLVFWFAGFLVPLQAAETIPIIGSDKSGNEIIVHVSRQKYIESMREMLMATQRETVPALDHLSSIKQWNLRTLALGIGVEATLGVSPFFQLGIQPRFRALFTNSSKPVIP
jgi:hypothetical protein